MPSDALTGDPLLDEHSWRPFREQQLSCDRDSDRSGEARPLNIASKQHLIFVDLDC